MDKTKTVAWSTVLAVFLSDMVVGAFGLYIVASIIHPITWVQAFIITVGTRLLFVSIILPVKKERYETLLKPTNTEIKEDM